jgi:hypothetical protein
VEQLENIMDIVNSGDRTISRLMVFYGATAMSLAMMGIYGGRQGARKHAVSGFT